MEDHLAVLETSRGARFRGKVFLPRRGTTGRRRRDALLLAVGLVGFVLSILWVRVGRFPPLPRPERGDPPVILSPLTTAEREVFGLINKTPDALHMPLWTVMQFGSLAAVPMITAVALVGRRPRLAATVASSGTTAWLVAKLIKQIVARDRPDMLLVQVIIRGRPAGGLGFPSGHAAVAAALMTVISPYLSPPVRRVGWTGVVLVGVARIYVGAHLPLDVVGGFFLGLVVGSSVNLVLRTPARPVMPAAESEVCPAP